MQSLPFHKPFLAVMESVSDTSRYFKNGTLMPILPLFHLLQVKGAWMQERPSDIGGWGGTFTPRTSSKCVNDFLPQWHPVALPASLHKTIPAKKC